MRRFDWMKAVAARMGDEIVVTNLANTASEWHAARPSEGNLYAVGMGMVTPYALGLALALPHRRVVALDGDGGILFEPSILGVAATAAVPNLTIVVFDNGGYVSTGRLPTVASLSAAVSIEAVARAFGIADAVTVTDADGFAAAYERDAGQSGMGRGPRVVVARIGVEQAFVGPLPMDLKENKYRFVRHVERSEGRRILKPSAKEHGAAPAADPVGASVTTDSPFGRVLHEGLKENGVDFVVGLPCTGFASAQGLLMADDAITYVPVANEGTGLAICAGAWLGGKRPAAVIENFGLFAGVYQLLRGHLSYGIPTLIVAEYRGDTGDAEFFAEGGAATLDVLGAMGINHRLVEDVAALKPAIRDALRWMDACLRPFAIVPAFDLTRTRVTGPR